MKLINEWKPPALYRWIKLNLPARFELYVDQGSYSCSYLIYPAGTRPKGLFAGRGYPIAEIWSDNTIRLYEQNYFSDMQDLLRRYEEEFKAETVLRYSDSQQKRV